MTYFCIKCLVIHGTTQTDTSRVFKTGFHLLPNRETIPLGLCHTVVSYSPHHAHVENELLIR